MKRAEEVKNDVFPIVFLVFLCVSASPFHPFVVLREYCWTHMCNTLLHAWVCQKSERILSVSFSVMCILRLFQVMDASMCCPFTLQWYSSMSSLCSTCHWHACCMMHHHMTFHELIPTSSQHPLFTIRHPFQVTWPPHSPQTHLPWVKNEPLLKWIS